MKITMSYHARLRIESELVGLVNESEVLQAIDKHKSDIDQLSKLPEITVIIKKFSKEITINKPDGHGHLNSGEYIVAHIKEGYITTVSLRRKTQVLKKMRQMQSDINKYYR